MARLNKTDKQHFLPRCKKQPYKAIRAAFDIYHLDDIREEIHLWKEIALSNDLGIYDDGESRENLILYCNELARLAEALFIASQEHAHKKNQKQNGLSKEAAAIVERSNKPEYLTGNEENNPVLVIHQFFGKFSFKYSKIELTDMLESVISYEGKREVDKGYLIVLYKCLKRLIKSARAITKRQSRIIPGG